MSYSIVNRPLVKIDIINATTYYKKINPQLAKEFIYRLREAKNTSLVLPLVFNKNMIKQEHYFLNDFHIIFII